MAHEAFVDGIFYVKLQALKANDLRAVALPEVQRFDGAPFIPQNNFSRLHAQPEEQRNCRVQIYFAEKEKRVDESVNEFVHGRGIQHVERRGEFVAEKFRAFDSDGISRRVIGEQCQDFIIEIIFVGKKKSRFFSSANSSAA